MQTLAPFRLRPWFRTRIWGVRNLVPWYDYKVEGEPIGEVWLSGDDCVVDAGPLAGMTFRDVFEQHGEALLGPERSAMLASDESHERRFPLLTKVLFPQEKLSVQVHPDDAMARQKGEPHGKTECWYALEAVPGGAVALGFHPGATEASVRAAIESSRLEELLNWVPVKKGDMIFVDAGTVHAIGPGLVLLETQQNSDMTYRLYDYGRPRELHLENGFRAMRMQTQAGKVEARVDGHRAVLMEAKYFRIDRFALDEANAVENFGAGIESGRRDQSKQNTVQLIFVSKGSGRLESAFGAPIELRRGDLAVIPACVEQWQMTAAEPMEMLRAVPQ